MNGTPRKITISRRLRPLRLAFLVSPNDRNAINKIIQINTCIWGGMFNAIVPVYRKPPAWWEDTHSRISSANEITRGYIDAFEPDFIITTRPELTNGIDEEKHFIKSIEDVFSSKNEGHVAYGVSVMNIYRALYDSEYKYVHKHPQKVVIPSLSDDRLALFSNASFGCFPDEKSLKYFENGYREVFEAENISVDASNLFDIFIRMAKPLGVGKYGIKVWNAGHIPNLFYMDASKTRDIIDYWNLRALGWRVIPIPKQWASELIDASKNFIKANYIRYRNSLLRIKTTTVVKSRSIDQDEFNSFADNLRASISNYFRAQLGYPRLWNRFERNKDMAQRCNLSAQDDDIECIVEHGRIQFNTLSPIYDKEAWAGYPRWANVIQMRGYSSAAAVAYVLPPRLRNIARIMGTIPFNTTSANSEGIVIRCERWNDTHFWKIPDGFTVFRTWLTDKGIEAEMSESGLVTSKLIDSLGGLFQVGIIAKPEVIDLLDMMARGLAESEFDENDKEHSKPRVRGHIIGRKQWWGVLSKINNNNKIRAESHLKAIIDCGILKIGIRIKCTDCQQTNWYPLDKLSERVRCERCLKDFDFPSVSPPQDIWYYRTQGPFSVDKYANGGYTIALALRFLVDFIIGEKTWVPSIKIKDITGSESEIDFSIWFEDVGSELTMPKLIIGEAKSYNDFEARDIRRAKKLREIFPETIFVFATLKKELGQNEKARIRRLANLWKKSPGYSEYGTPIIILTQTELMSNISISYSYEKLGGKFSKFTDRISHGKFAELCDITQKLHLDIDSN